MIMSKNIKEVDIDRSDSITENHNKFVLSDYDKSNQKWLCRCCGEYVFYTKIRKHLLDLHNLSIVSYYNQYVDPNTKCLVKNCNHLVEMDKLTRISKSCENPEHKKICTSAIQSKTMESQNKEWWSDPEYREDKLKELKKHSFDSETVSARNREWWSDPEYRKWMHKIQVDSNENPKYILSNARKMRRVGLDKKSKYAGKYKTKWLYCFKLRDNCIKIGTTGSKKRLKALLTISDDLVFKVLGESSEMMVIEDMILNNTEDYFVYFDKNSEIYKIGGRAEIRDIKCLPYILKTIKDLGLIYDND